MGNLLIRSGNYIRDRRNFLKFAVVCFGSVASAISLVFFGSYGGWPLWIFIVIISCLTGYFWGVAFWALFLKNVFHQK